MSLAWQFTGRPGAGFEHTAYDQRRHVLYYISTSGTESFDTVSAVNVATGELLWQDSFPAGQDLFVNHISGLLVYQNYLVVAPDPTAVMLNGTQLTVWILNAATGSTERAIAVPSKAVVAGISRGNVIIAEDTSLLDSSGSASPSPILSAYSLSSGREIWHESSSCDHGQVADDAAIVVACDSAIEGLNPADGSTIWRYRVTGGWGDWQVSLSFRRGHRGPGKRVGDVPGRARQEDNIGEHQHGVCRARPGVLRDSRDEPDIRRPEWPESIGRDQRQPANGPRCRSGSSCPPESGQPASSPESGYYPAGLSIADDAMYLPVDLPQMFIGGALLEVNMADGSRLLRFAPSQLSSCPRTMSPVIPLPLRPLPSMVRPCSLLIRPPPRTG